MLALVAALALTGAAVASPGDPGPDKRPPTAEDTAPPVTAAAAKGGVPRLIFPVLGPAEYTNDFGDPRSQGRHEGIDIVAPKRAAAVAAEAGRVEIHATSAQGGCMLYLHGRSGTEYLYVHLNNDLTKANDNRGKCVAGVAYAKGLKDGASVAAGEPIALVGDSGDADGITAHLHFEVHPKARGAVNPYPHLRRAQPLLFAAKPGTLVDLTLSGDIVEAFDGVLSLYVDRLAARPVGFELARVGRMIDLTMPPEAVVFDPLGALITAATLAQAEPGQSATVETVPAKTTLRAELGEPLELAASTVRLGNA